MTNEEMIKQIWEHILVMNREMGAVQQNLEWLNWAVKGIIAGIAVSIFLSIWNLWLHKKNNKE